MPKASAKGLAKLRQQKGVSRTELAAALHTSESAVTKWEQGAREPGLQSLRKLSAYFGVTVDEIVRALTTQGKGGR